MSNLIGITIGLYDLSRWNRPGPHIVASGAGPNLWAPFKGGYGALTTILGAFALFLLLIWQVVPSWVLLARSLPQRGRLNPIGRALLTLFGLWLRGLQARSMHRAARLRIEIELLDPMPERPLRLHFGPKADYKAAKNRWRKDKRTWSIRVRTQLGELVQEVHEGESAAIDVDTCSPLIDNDAIERYFDALNHPFMHVRQNPVFLSKVTIKQGFTAPLHLLTGVLARYEQDWQQIVKEYGRSIIRPDDEFRYRHARKLQLFIFDCWLLWGPSIPICTCPEWQGEVALQYGFGDENNSLILRCGTPEVLRSLNGQNASGIKGFAVRSRVTGTLKWGPVLGPGNGDVGFCPAQVAIWQDSRLVLDVTGEAQGIRPAGGTEEQVFAQYYSAYLWIAFVMCNKDTGEPLNPNHPWRDMIPFFMHANIADIETYDFYASQLARSALESASEMLREEGNDDLILRFVCALDETGCGYDSLYQLPERETIREKMIRHADRPGAVEFRSVRRRLILDYHPNEPFKDGDYSACALPAIINDHYCSMDADSLTFHELRGTRRGDIELFKRFYKDCLKPEFPDPDELENVETIINYLRLKETGWYEKNNYHVILALDDGKPVGGAIADYLDGPNAGVIEYLVVQPERRNKGVGRRLLEHTERALHDDADTSRGRQLHWIVAELDDPYLTPRSKNGLDPFARLGVWGQFGYQRLDFPYVQPALEKNKKPVETLMLIAKLCPDQFASDDREQPEAQRGRESDSVGNKMGPDSQRGRSVPSNEVEMLVREYLRWAMRIEEPDSCDDFVTMADSLRAERQIELVTLKDYLGRENDGFLYVTDIVNENDPELNALIRLYEKFKNPDPMITGDTFRQFFQKDGLTHRPGYRYHLWKFRSGDPEWEGVASFMTAPSSERMTSVGICHYLSLADSIYSVDRLRPLVARIEERMMRDANGASGWGIDCRGDIDREVLTEVGFREPDAGQSRLLEQSLLSGAGTASSSSEPRHMLYKRFGRVY